jgi:hypothetical protein
VIEQAHIMIAIAGFVGGALGAVFAIRTELRYIRRDVDRAHDRLNQHDKVIYGTPGSSGKAQE